MLMAGYYPPILDIQLGSSGNYVVPLGYSYCEYKLTMVGEGTAMTISISIDDHIYDELVSGSYAEKYGHIHDLLPGDIISANGDSIGNVSISLYQYAQ